MKAIEMYYTVQDLATLLRYQDAWVRERVKEGAFLDPHFVPRWAGDQDVSVVEIGGETRIAASAVNRFLAGHAKATVNPVKARNMAEVRRKCARGNGEVEVSPAGVFRGGGN